MSSNIVRKTFQSLTVGVDEWPDDESSKGKFELTKASSAIEMTFDEEQPMDSLSRSTIVGSSDDPSTSSGSLTAADKIVEPPPSPPPRCCSGSCGQHPRVKELYTSADYWSLWIGLATFGLALFLVFVVPYDKDSTRARYVVPQPMPWNTNPFVAWDAYGIVGTVLLLVVVGAMYLASCKFRGALERKEDPTSPTGRSTEPSLTFQYASGFGLMGVLATMSLWVGRNVWCDEHGLGYAVFSILFGMLVTNVRGGNQMLERFGWTKAAKDGEFFIKCSLVLLAVQFDTLLSVGVPGIVVAWVGSPLAIIFGYMVGTRLMKCDDALAILIAVGASWCGASAISAVAPIVQATSEQVALSISVVSFFTLGFTFVQPYIALAVNMPDDVAGAWIGASVDQTGNVLVSAAIVSEKATEVAGIVKMVLNAALGVMASVIACWWSSRRREGDDEENRPKFSLILLWDKFPKFTIGFLITSAILTGTQQHIEGTAEAQALPRAISALNRWLFAIAFVGIGLTTNISKLWDAAIKSGIIQVYLFTNVVDIFLALGLAYLLF